MSLTFTVRLVAGWPVVDIVVLSLQKSELLLDESTVLLLVPVVLKKRSCVISRFHILFYFARECFQPKYCRTREQYCSGGLDKSHF